MTGDGHWHRHAQQWALLGPPLRPSPEDLDRVRPYARPAAAILGVTPELVALLGPTAIPIDRARAMIGALATPGAVVADWRALPLAARALDLVVGDGALTCLPFPAGYAALAGELARVLRPGGRFVTRVFARPAAPEPLAAIPIADVRSIHALKWRIAMAAPHPTNLPVVQLRAAFDALVPDRAALPYPRAAVDMIDNYARSPIVYSFPTVDETIAALAPHFTAEVLPCPTSYELAERCPTLVFTAR